MYIIFGNLYIISAEYFRDAVISDEKLASEVSSRPP